MTPLEIIRKAQEDVAVFEDPLSWILAPCKDEVGNASTFVDPIEFAAFMYNLVRRVEAAAAKYARENEPRIREEARRIKLIIPDISAMEAKVNEMIGNTPLEQAGKEYLLDRFSWALWILKERLPEWGY